MSAKLIRSLFGDLYKAAKTIDKHPWWKFKLFEESAIRNITSTDFFLAHRRVDRMRNVVVKASAYYQNESIDEKQLLDVGFDCLRAMNRATQDYDKKKGSAHHVFHLAHTAVESKDYIEYEVIEDDDAMSPEETVKDLEATRKTLDAVGMKTSCLTEEEVDQIADVLPERYVSRRSEADSSKPMSAKEVKFLIEELVREGKALMAFAALAAWRVNRNYLGLEQQTLFELGEMFAERGVPWVVLALFHETKTDDNVWMLTWLNLLIQASAKCHDLELGMDIYEIIRDRRLFPGVVEDETTITNLAKLCSYALAHPDLTREMEHMVVDRVRELWESPRESLNLG
ncbi:hypothetical protein AAMO2058_001523700 [Amorphochlora amoebiformis]